MVTVYFSPKSFYLPPFSLLFFPHSNSHSSPPYLRSADREFSAVEESICLTCEEYLAHLHLSLYVIALPFLAFYASVPTCVARTSSKALSPLLSAVISLPSSDSLAGAAICYNVFFSCVCACLELYVDFACFTPNPCVDNDNTHN